MHFLCSACFLFDDGYEPRGPYTYFTTSGSSEIFLIDLLRAARRHELP
jgi:hypothetical protein